MHKQQAAMITKIKQMLSDNQLAQMKEIVEAEKEKEEKEKEAEEAAEED